MASSSSSRPAFIFSYNLTDPDVAALLAASSLSSHRGHAGLGASTRTRRNNGYGYGDDDDEVPVYGPTTHRKGPMRFVPARAAQFGVLPAADPRDGHTVDLKGKGRAVDPEDDKEDDVKPDIGATPPRQSTALSGPAVRGLYAGIVGLGSSAPASLHASPAPAAPLAPDPGRVQLQGARVERQLKREEDASPPLRPPADDNDVLVLSSDSESEPAGTRGYGPGDGDGDDDDDLIVMDPLTGQPESRPSTSSTAASGSGGTRPQPLLIHQLLPSSSSSSPAPGAIPPYVPAPHYAIKPDNPGFRMLLAQGWREGAALGAPPAPGEQPRGLMVPLRAKEKFDRRGLGGDGGEAERRLTPREREEVRRRKEREERERRGKGTRGMERARKDEERRRKAMIAYMNR
ncbi:hypothetical protein JCM3770_006549 [Rhodotorula araucariae]